METDDVIVKDWMTKTVITVTPADTLSSVDDLLERHGFHCLPVLSNDRMVGVITDRDIKRASPSETTMLTLQRINALLGGQQVKSFMQQYPVVVYADGTLDEAAYLLLEHKQSSLPVVSEGANLVGMISRTDILNAYISLTNCPGRGLQFGLLTKDRPGAVAAAVLDIWTAGGRIASILSTTDKAPQGYRRYFVRAYDIPSRNSADLKQRLLKKEGIYFLIDQEKNQRDWIAEIDEITPNTHSKLEEKTT
jgi:acetoin utilization protein AcuB